MLLSCDEVSDGGQFSKFWFATVYNVSATLILAMICLLVDREMMPSRVLYPAVFPIWSALSKIMTPVIK